MKRIDISQFKKDHSFYGEMDLLLTVKSFDLQAIRKRYLDSKKNKRSGSAKRREPAVGGVVSLSISKGKILNEEVLCCLKEPRGIDFLNNKLAISSEDKVFVVTDDLQTIENDFFSYIHTVSFSPFDENKLMISSSGFDCIFEYDTRKRTSVWEWFAWENGFDKGKNPETNADIFITRDKNIAIQWKKEKRSFILIDDPKTQHLPTAQRSAFINSVAYHSDQEHLILATFFHEGKMMQINKLNNSITSVLDNMHHPHGGKRSDKLCLATSTNSGEVVIVENEKERRYFTANLKGKSAELGEMEWLQNSILWGNFILTIDSNRTAFIVFDPINKLYDMIPYDMDWAIQDIVGGKLKEIQKNILKEISLSI